MRNALPVGLLITAIAACHRTEPARPAAANSANVFTDSTLHARYCMPPEAGQDWRHVCTPRDQGHLPMPRPERKP